MPKVQAGSRSSEAVVRAFRDRIRFVFRHFPQHEVHPHALQAAEVAECAGGQARFWQMYDLLFDNQRYLDLVRLYGYARTLELDMARFAADMDVVECNASFGAVFVLDRIRSIHARI